MYIAQSMTNQSQRSNCSSYRMSQNQMRLSIEDPGYHTNTVAHYGSAEPPYCWPQEPEDQSRRNSEEDIKQEADDSQEVS